MIQFDWEKLNKLPASSVKFIAESVGIGSLNEASSSYLADDVNFRISELIETSKKFMRKSKRRKLMACDVDRALRVRGVEPLYGASASGSSVPFRFASGGGRELHFHEDREVDLGQFINTGIPKAPNETELKAHWLAIDGLQPAIPQNPVQPSTSASQSQDRALRRKASQGFGDDKKNKGDKGATEATLVRSESMHELSVEQQLFFKEISEACVGSDENRRIQCLHSLSTDTGLQPLVPRIMVFLAEGMRLNVIQNNLAILIYLMRVVKALLENQALNLSRHLHLLLPSILSCVLGRQLCNKPEIDNHWALREFGARIVAQATRHYATRSLLGLQPRVSAMLSELLRSERTATDLSTIYGAVSTCADMGVEVSRQLVLPQIRSLSERVQSVLEDPTVAPAQRIAGDHVRNALVKLLTVIYKTGVQSHTVSEQDILHEVGSFLGNVVISGFVKMYGGNAFAGSPSGHLHRPSSALSSASTSSNPLNRKHRIIVVRKGMSRSSSPASNAPSSPASGLD